MQTLNVDTSDLIRVERALPSAAPSLDQPGKSPFFISQFPTTSIVNPDQVRNFHTPQIPTYRITPPLPLALSGAASNSVASVKTASISTPQPPAPIVSQTLVSIPTGYTFTFLQVKLPASVPPGAVISTYRIYRNTTNTTGGATVVHLFIHNPANGSDAVVFQDSQPNATTQFYWVSSVNVSGVESTLTPAQGGAVTNNAALNSNSQLASSFHSNALNTAFAPTSATSLSNNGSTSIIVVSATTNQFGPSGIAYNSGSVDPGTTGSFAVFADDSQFQGGPVIYQVALATSVQTQCANDARVLFGAITTSSLGTTTGGGNTGGTTQNPTGGGVGIPATGGRGFLSLS
jgi:hypothetical protein